MTSAADRQCILLVDDERHVTDALALVLEQPGRTVIVCSDVESAEICLERYDVTHLVSDVQFSGPFGFEGLHFLDRIRTLAPRCRIVVMTGLASEPLRASALDAGASAVLTKPFAAEDLERALGSTASSAATDAYEVIRTSPIDEILAGDTMTAAFQPIVRLSPDGPERVGWEALARTSERWLSGPAALFDYAYRRSRLAELNVVAMMNAVTEAAALPASGALFFNIDPLTFGTRRLIQALERSAADAGVPLSRIVLEITERSAFAEERASLRVIDELRERGVRFAFDDHGSAYSHISLIDSIRPSFIKVSQTFGTAFEQDDTKVRILRNVISLSRDFGCETILEGIETGETAEAAAALGVPLAQGYYFGRPLSAAECVTRNAPSAA